jgi:hypothetical protein
MDGPAPSRRYSRRVLADYTTYVGLDVHKESILAEGGLRREVREHGRIANTACDGTPERNACVLTANAPLSARQ